MNLARMGVIESAFPPITSSGLKVRLEANDLSGYSGSGTAWTNVAGSQYSGTLVNGVQYTEANGGLFLFDGVDEYVNVNDSTVDWRMTTTPITLQSWVYFNSLTNSSGAGCGIFGKQSPSFVFDGYAVIVGASGDMRITTNGFAISKVHSSTHSALTTGTWYFLTAVLMLSETAGSIKGYRNDTQIVNGFHGNDTCNESNSLMLGRGFQWGSSPDSYLNGRIGAFYAYNKELSPEEISENFNATRRRYGV